MTESDNSGRPSKPRRMNSGAAVAIFGICLILLPFLLVLLSFGRSISVWFEVPTSGGFSLADIFVQKFHVVIGLPAAALFSLLLVAILRQTSGPIEFKALGFEFNGASGPVVLWLLCFLSIVLAVKLLW